MVCQICDHAVKKVGVMADEYTDVELFWCPRCGALRANTIAELKESPMLVGQCRTLLEQYKSDDRIIELMRVFSITESVTKEQE